MILLGINEKYSEWSEIDCEYNPVEIRANEDRWRINQYKYWREDRVHNQPPENGYWVLSLHNHLPFVRHPEHEVSLEEQWLFEAITSVYTTPSEYLFQYRHHKKLMPGISTWGKDDYFSTWLEGREYQPNT